MSNLGQEGGGRGGGNNHGAWGDNRKRVRRAKGPIDGQCPCAQAACERRLSLVRALSTPCAFLRVATFYALKVATVATFN